MSQEKQEEKKQIPEVILELVEKKPTFLNSALDMIFKIIKESVLFIEHVETGFRIKYNREELEKIKEEFDVVELSNIRDMFYFIGELVHSSQENSVDEFFDLVKEDKREKIKSIVEEITSHECYKPIAFRFLRDSNYLTSPIQYKTVSLKDEITGKYLEHYDIKINYALDVFNKKLIRLKMDKFEIEVLMIMLAKIIKSTNKNDNDGEDEK